MRNRISIILALGILLFSACKNEKVNSIKKSFDFRIEGNVKNGEGIELALYIPSQGMDKRIKSKIENGKYLFKGEFEKIEDARIVFEEDMTRDSNYESLPVFIEPNKVVFDFSIYGDSLKRRAKDFNLKSPSNTKYLYDTQNIVFREFSKMPYPKNNFEKDSLNKFIYPEIKKEILRTYDSLFNNSQYDGTSLFVLDHFMNNNIPFEYKNLLDQEKQKINYLFRRIDTSLSQTPSYKNLKSKIDIINSESNKLNKFKDFTFVDINNKKVKLSEIVKNNEFTVLDFWWSGCGPCRKFNRETTSEKYKIIKNQGIELISISTDRSQTNWRNSSKKDNITWVNLYAGATSEIINYYKIKKYPTKIIFDNQFNIVDFEFTEATELLKLKNIK
jgi:thiol-disulfide isomerase/thioredoxin